MMLLLDQGLPRSTLLHLRNAGVAAEHVVELGLATASNLTLIERARDHAQIIVTMDADFHTQLALSGALGPSVIRIRIEELKAPQLAQLILGVLEQCGGDLQSGAMVNVRESSVRVRHLPLIRS
jgi:predicted nuclease of predicted toxin-antitoxin system